MKRISGKMKHIIKAKQTGKLRTIAIYSACSALIIIIITSLFNLADIKKVKAKEFQIQSETEQVFITDFSLSAPLVKFTEKASPTTIFIQKKKPEPVSPTQNHE